MYCILNASLLHFRSTLFFRKKYAIRINLIACVTTLEFKCVIKMFFLSIMCKQHFRMHLYFAPRRRPWQSPGGGGGHAWGFLRWNNRYAGLVVTAPVHVPVSSSCHVNVFVCFCVFVSHPEVFLPSQNCNFYK